MNKAPAIIKRKSSTPPLFYPTPLPVYLERFDGRRCSSSASSTKTDALEQVTSIAGRLFWLLLYKAGLRFITGGGGLHLIKNIQTALAKVFDIFRKFRFTSRV